MTGAIVLIIVTALCAVGVLAAVLASQRPAEGWISWVRSALREWRRDAPAPGDRDDDEEVGGLGTLYLMSEAGSAYTRPEDLGSGLARLRGARSPHADLTAPAGATHAQA